MRIQNFTLTKVLGLLAVVLFLIVLTPFGLRYVFLGRFTVPTTAEHEAIARSGRAIVQAISDYRADHGLPPGTLEELVPKYLPKLDRNGWIWDSGNAALSHRAGLPHSFVSHWFSGAGADRWWFHGEWVKDQELNVPGRVAK